MRILALVPVLLSLSACIATTQQPHSHSSASSQGQQREGCPPAHHLEGGRCVHNGNGRHRGHD